MTDPKHHPAPDVAAQMAQIVICLTCGRPLSAHADKNGPTGHCRTFRANVTFVSPPALASHPLDTPPVASHESAAVRDNAPPPDVWVPKSDYDFARMLGIPDDALGNGLSDYNIERAACVRIGYKTALRAQAAEIERLQEERAHDMARQSTIIAFLRKRRGELVIQRDEAVAALREARPTIVNAATDASASEWQRETRLEILQRIDAILAKLEKGDGA